MYLLKNKKFHLAKRLSYTKRYVDDVCIANYTGFENLITEIYPQDLLMERSGDNNKNVNFLDVSINIQSSGIITNIYNKVDDFNFSVVSLTFPHSNISMEVGYNIFYSQLLRYYRICSRECDFINITKKLYKVLLNRRYDHWKMVLKFKRFIHEYNDILLKYNITNLSRWIKLILS